MRHGVDNALSTGSVVVNDGGIYDLNGFSDSIGALAVNSGATGGTVTTGAGTLTLTGNISSTGGAANASINGNLAFGATRSITTTNATDGLNIPAVISGAGGLTKAGAGTLTLSGANTYAGATTVSAGTLFADNALALGATGSGTTITSGATLKINNVVIGGETVSLAGIGVGGNGAITGTGTTSLVGNVTQTAASTIGTTNAASSLTLSGAYSAPSASTIIGAGRVAAINAANNFSTVNVNNAANVSLRDANAIVLNSANVAGNLSVQTGGAITQTGVGAFTAGGTTTLTAGAGNDITFNNAANNFAIVAINGGRDVSLVDANALTLNASTAKRITARTLSNDLTLGGAITATGTGTGTSITLASAGNFNNAGNFGLTPGSGSRWLVYSTNPALDTRGAGLLSDYNFKQYNTAYPGVIAGSGNGFIYSIAPTVTVSLSGSADKIYSGTNTTPVSGLMLSQTRTIDGDTVNLSALTGASYDNKNVGAGKTVTTNALSISGASNGAKNVFGYTLSSPTASAAVGTITPRPITAITGITADNKVYVGTTAATIDWSAASFTNIVSGDNLILASGTGAFADKNAGLGKTVNISGLSLGGLDVANYSLATSSASTTSDIFQRSITVTAVANTKIYDSTAASAGAPTVTSGLIVAGETGNFNQAFNNKNAGTGKTLIASGTVNDGISGGNYAVTFLADNTGTITPAALSLNAVTDTKVYDGTTTSSGALATSGLVDGGTIDGLSQSFASKDVLGMNGSIMNVNGGFILNDGNGGNNYIVSQNSAPGTINPAALSINANNLSKTYGQQIAFTGEEFTAVGLVTGENIGTVNLTSAGADNLAKVTDGSYIITISDATGGSFNTNNYNITYNEGSLTVNPAALSITANDARKLQGSPNPAFNGSFSGFVNGEDSSVLSGVLSFSTPAETKSPIGQYFIRPFGVTADNYAISFIDGTLSVTASAALPNPEPNPNPVSSPIAVIKSVVTRLEQAVQPCKIANSNDNMLTGMAAFGLDNINYLSSFGQPLVGGVVANALVKPSCFKL